MTFSHLCYISARDNKGALVRVKLQLNQERRNFIIPDIFRYNNLLFISAGVFQSNIWAHVQSRLRVIIPFILFQVLAWLNYFNNMENILYLEAVSPDHCYPICFSIFNFCNMFDWQFI